MRTPTLRAGAVGAAMTPRSREVAPQGTNGRQGMPEHPAPSDRSRQPRHAPLGTARRRPAGAAGRAEPSHAPDRLSERSERTQLAVAVGRAAALDTTAQLRQQPRSAADILTRRAKSKLLTDISLEGLLELGTSTPLSKAYRRTQACALELRNEGGKLTGRYCGNRWCLVCNRIRTAKLREAYTPVLRDWTAPYFVTLTIPNVPAAQLHGAVRTMVRALQRISLAMRRTDRLPLTAVRKIECTYNPERRDFHPHFHLVVRDRHAAHILLRRWLEAFPDAKRRAQDVRQARAESLMAELFKYLTKMVIRQDKRVRRPPPRALDVIFRALRGLRTVQPMGFRLSRDAETVTDEDAELELTANVAARMGDSSFRWHHSLTDWVDESTGELLTGYTPGRAMNEIIRQLRAPPCHSDTLDAGENAPNHQRTPFPRGDYERTRSGSVRTCGQRDGTRSRQLEA